jgi:hypothetical protein
MNQGLNKIFLKKSSINLASMPKIGRFTQAVSCLLF